MPSVTSPVLLHSVVVQDSYTYSVELRTKEVCVWTTICGLTRCVIYIVEGENICPIKQRNCHTGNATHGCAWGRFVFFEGGGACCKIKVTRCEIVIKIIFVL